jgi:WD40 repeat protein
VKLWEARTGRLLRSFEGHTGWLRNVALSPDGATIASRSVRGAVKVWDLATGHLIATPAGAEEWLRGDAEAHLGNVAADGTRDGRIKICERGTGKLIATFVAFDDKRWVAYTPDGFFDAPESAWPLIGLTDKLVSYPVEEFAEHFHRPDILRERLRQAIQGAKG